MSGIYLPNMEMPKSCGACKMHFLGDPDYVCCGITDRIPKVVAKYRNSRTDLDARKASIESVARPDWCPLVPVPEHGRLIDANALTYVMGTDERFSPLEALYLMGVIADAPTIIPASGTADKEGET